MNNKQWMLGKQIILFILLAFGPIYILSCGTLLTQSKWNIQVIDRFNTQSSGIHTTDVTTIAAYGAQSSLAFNSAGEPRIAYYALDDQALKYASFYNGTWNIETVDSPATGGNPSLALDSTGMPHIAYLNHYPKGYDLMYARYNGITWEIQTVNNTAIFTCPSLKIGTDDKPRISYRNGGDGGYLTLMTYTIYTGTTWEITTISTSGAGSSSLALDDNNNLYIAFNSFNYNSQEHSIEYAVFNGISWEVETVENPDCGWATVSLALDSSNNPYISYTYSSGNSSYIKYAYKSSGVWYTEKIDPSLYGYETSLAVDNNGTVRLSYYGSYGIGDTGIQYSSKEATGWSHEVVDPDATVGDRAISLKLLNNKPYIAYYDTSSKSLKFASQL